MPHVWDDFALLKPSFLAHKRPRRCGSVSRAMHPEIACRFGLEVCYAVAVKGTEFVKIGHVIVDDGDRLTVCAPAAPGEQSVRSVKAGDGTEMPCIFEIVMKEHVQRMEDAKLPDGVIPLKFAKLLDTRAAAAAVFGDPDLVSSDGQHKAPPHNRREKAGASSVGGSLFAGLAANAGLWGQRPEDEPSSSESEAEAAPGGAVAAGVPWNWMAPPPAPKKGVPPRAAVSPQFGGFPMAYPMRQPGMPGPSSGAAAYGLPQFPPGYPGGQAACAAPWTPGLTRGGKTGAAAPGPGMPFDMNAMVQMEMLHAIRRLGRRGGESDSEDEEGKPQTDKAFKGLHQMRRRYEKHPEKVIGEFVDRMRRELGVSHPHQYWKVADYSGRVQPQFGRLRGLYRCHYACAEALQEYLAGRPDHMAAQVALLLQCLHQVALDAGEWQNGALVMMHPDPLSRPEFGAGQTEMARIAAYRRALADLHKKQGGPKADEKDEHEDAGDKKSGKGKKKWGKKEEK